MACEELNSYNTTDPVFCGVHLRGAATFHLTNFHENENMQENIGYCSMLGHYSLFFQYIIYPQIDKWPE